MSIMIIKIQVVMGMFNHSVLILTSLYKYTLILIVQSWNINNFKNINFLQNKKF